MAYSLGITDLDPLRYGLIFERFLNPGRREMPDIDMDFDERYRSDVIRYASDRYGSDHVPRSSPFATIKGKQAIRDSYPGARAALRPGRPDDQADAARRAGQGGLPRHLLRAAPPKRPNRS